MLRWVGGSLIIGGTLGMGLLYRQRLYERLELLKELIRVLELLKSEVNYGQSPLPECFGKVAKQIGDGFGMNKMQGMLEATWHEMEENDGERLKDVFYRKLKDGLLTLPLEERDVEIFGRFVFEAGVADKNLQVRLIDMSKEQLEEQYHNLREKIGERTRLAVGLGILSGIFLVLFLM